MKTTLIKPLLAVAIVVTAASTALTASATLTAPGHTKGREVTPFTREFKPGTGALAKTKDGQVWPRSVRPCRALARISLLVG